MPICESLKSGPPSTEIRQMFDRLAHRYDVFNHLTGLGLATFWRQRSLQGLKRGMKVLDVGCGTGDLALQASKIVGDSGAVTGIDFSERMLEFARLRGKGKPIRWVAMKAEDLPLEEGHYDVVVSGFVLRNLYENITGILDGVYRSLKPGGRLSFLDFTEPRGTLLKVLWRSYMNTAAALYGKMLFGRDYPDLYLTESASRFLKPDEFKTRLAQAGFKDVSATFMLFGIVVLYRAVK